MKPSSSLAGRAVLALILMIGFYLLAVAISVGLLYIPYAELVYAHRLHIKLALGCVLGAVVILWSVLPRADKFEAPGPELLRAAHPRLFSDLEAVAKAVGQAMPAEVYLVGDVNAWVSQRGGIMGFGSRRVMGLGLPLMRVLTCSQFRAVLAHEFGHYHGGDTKLGPWIYKTRNAIGRTLASLAGEGGQGSLLQLPFLWYAKMFLRITHAVSRRQEFLADEVAARAVGAKPLIDGLLTVHGVGPAYQAYWAGECAPVLQAGYHPPLAEGFQAFVQANNVAAVIANHLAEEMKGLSKNPYDTHPPLRERIEALSALPPGEVPAEDPPATSLLADVPALETELLASMAGAEVAAKLKTVQWNDVSAQVYIPQWAQMVNANKTGLKGLTPESLPLWSHEWQKLNARFQQTAGEEMGPAIVGAALALLLIQRGGKLQAEIGQPITVLVASHTILPFALVQNLGLKKLEADVWIRQCEDLGVAKVDLGEI